RLSRGTFEPNRRPVDLVALTREVVELVRTEDRTIHLPDTSVTANVDPALVARVIENLLANAAKYTPAGTPIWVDAQRHDGGALLIVEDAGPGIPPESRAAVFEPFHRLDPDHPSPGAGLGLTLVAEFARLHGGLAGVGDRGGGGTRFEVWLPDEPAPHSEGHWPAAPMTPHIATAPA
ncbi:MAG TPA: sensor histidine kinase, partial [Nitriliruptorales bacterium]